MFIYYAYICIAAFLFALLGARLMIVRHEALPKRTRLSGISLVFALIVFLLLLDAPISVVASMALLAGLGFTRDWMPVPRFFSTVLQLLTISICLQFSGLTPLESNLQHWLQHIVLLGIWFGIIQLFIRADAIDGMACSWFISVAVILVAIGIFTNQFGNASSSYGLISATAGLGFIWWNWPPAKIALGDTGKYAIGFLLGFFMMLLIYEGHTASACIAAAYFLGDVVLTSIQQKIRKEPKLPLHMVRALKSGRAPKTIVRYVIGVHILLAFLAVSSVNNPENALVYAVFAYILVLVMLWWFAKTGPNDDTAI